MNQEKNIRFRYPGLSSFTLEQKGLFYGRRRETRELFNLVAVEKTVVLFSKSGLGKTSLINAGVTPLLLASDIYPVPIRFGNESLMPEQHFSIQLDAAWRRFRGEDPNKARDSSATETLWEQTKRCVFEKNGAVFTPALLFDQFEELFTLYPQPEKRARFTTELADLIGEKLPQAFREALLDQLDAGHLDSSALAEAEKAPHLKFVFSIRSDMLHFMDELSEQIPYILRSRYQLFGLTDEQAREAITQPAALQDALFTSPPFSYSADALNEILEVLTKNREVESFQLQAVCQAMEERIIHPVEGSVRAAHPGAPQRPGELLITPAFYGHRSGLGQILEEFYQKRLAELPEGWRKPAALLIELALINENNRRRSVDQSELLAQPDVTPQLLRALEDKRLVRKEPRLDTFYYEISHDTLLAPILKFRKERLDTEEKVRLEQEAVDARRARDRARKRLAVSTILTVLAVVASVFAFFKQTEAKIALGNVEKQKHVADSLLVVSRENEIQADAARADAETQSRKAELQRMAAVEALDKAKAEERARLAAEKDKTTTEIARLLREADVFLRAEEWDNARSRLSEVLRLDPDNEVAKKILKRLE
jgi:hypothetical protein